MSPGIGSWPPFMSEAASAPKVPRKSSAATAVSGRRVEAREGLVPRETSAFAKLENGEVLQLRSRPDRCEEGIQIGIEAAGRFERGLALVQARTWASRRRDSSTESPPAKYAAACSWVQAWSVGSVGSDIGASFIHGRSRSARGTYRLRRLRGNRSRSIFKPRCSSPAQRAIGQAELFTDRVVVRAGQVAQR